MPPPAEGIASRFVLGPALRTQPDRRLVTLVREGYESAFEEIVRRYGKPLGRYAASIVGGRSEDVTQDAFSKALLALRRDDAEIELRPWLFRIVRNTALNDLRDSPPAPEALAEAIAGGRGVAEEVEQRAELTDLIERLQALPEPQRAAIVMRELEGLSHEEIAAALGVTGGAARQTIHRARRALRNGAGMLVPLPLLKAMLTGAAAPSAAEAAVGAAGMGSAAGAGVALKATAATVLVAGAVGAGVAIDDSPHSGDARATPSRESGGSAGHSETAVPDTSESDEDRHGSGSDDGSHRGRGKGEPGDDRGGHGNERGDDGSSGPGGGGSSGSSGDSSGSSGSGSSGGGNGSGSGSGIGGGSGFSGGSGSGGSGSNSGSGSRGGESGSIESEEPGVGDDLPGGDNSGSGSGSDSSGSGS